MNDRFLGLAKLYLMNSARVIAAKNLSDDSTGRDEQIDNISTPRCEVIDNKLRCAVTSPRYDERNPLTINAVSTPTKR